MRSRLIRARKAARNVGAGLAVVCAVMLLWFSPEQRPLQGAPADDSPPGDAGAVSEQKERPPHQNMALRGRVVWMAEALERLYGVPSDPDAAQVQVALETVEGRLFPIVKDARGRGFWLDPRLRERDLELLVRVYEGSPAVQVIRVYSLRKVPLQEEGKFELDYWCDVCAIPMYELKACECCQGEIRIRERRVEDTKETP